MQKKILLPLLLAGPVAIPAFAQGDAALPENIAAIADEIDGQYTDDQIKTWAKQIIAANTQALNDLQKQVVSLNDTEVLGTENNPLGQTAAELYAKQQSIIDDYTTDRDNYGGNVKFILNGLEVNAGALYKDLNSNNINTIKAVFEKYNLYPEADGSFPSAEAINAITEEVVTLIKDINDENTAYDNYQKNLQQYNDLIENSANSVANLQQQITELEEQVNDSKITSEMKKEYQAKLAELQTQLDAYQDYIDETFPMPVNENASTWRGTIMTDQVQEKVDALQTALTEGIEEVKSDFTADDDNFNTYWEVNIVAMNNLKAAYTKLANYLENVKGVTSYTYEGETIPVSGYADIYYNQFFTTLIGENEDGTIAKLYFETKAANTIDGIEPKGEPGTEGYFPGAYEYNLERDCLGEINKVVDQFNNLYDEYSAKFPQQNEYMQEDLATTAGFNAMVENYKTQYAHLSGKSKEAFDNGIAPIVAAITKYNETYIALYEEQKLQGNSNDLRQEVFVANGNFDNILKAIAVISDLQAYLNSAENTVKQFETSNNEINPDYQFPLYSKVEFLFTAIQEKIDEIEPNPNYNGADIKAEITGVIKTASTLQSNYLGVAMKLTKMDNNYAGFTTYIKDKTFSEYKGLYFNNGEFTPDGVKFQNFTNFINSWLDGTQTGYGDPTAEGDDITDPDYKQLGAQLSGYTSAFDNAYAALGQKCINDFAALAESLDQTAFNTFNNNIIDAEVAFEKLGTGGFANDDNYGINYPNTASVVIGPLFQYLQKGGETDYKDRVGYNDAFYAINTLLGKVANLGKTIASEAATGETAIEAYLGYDKQLYEFLVGVAPTYGEDGEVENEGNLNTLDYYAAIAKYVQQMDANWDAYDSMIKQLNELQQTLDDVVYFNGQTSGNPEPAQSFFNDILGGYQNDINDLTQKVEEEYQQMTANDYDNNNLDSEINELENKIKSVQTWISNNLKNWQNEQNTWSSDAKNAIDTAYASLKSAYDKAEAEGQTDIAEMIEGWMNAVDALYETSEDPLNLDAVNQESNDLFGKGGLYDPTNTENPNLPHDVMIEKYQDIIDAAEEYVDMLESKGYYDEIIKADGEYFKSWKTQYGDVNNYYLNSIDVYKYFELLLTNQGWKNYVRDIVLDHSQLQDYYDQLVELNNNFLEMYNGALGYEDGVLKNAPELITKEQYEKYTDQAEDILTKMTDYMNQFIDQMNTKAESYYPEVQGPALTAINEAEAALSGAGIDPTGYLKEFNGLYNLAVDVYTSSVGLDDVEKDIVPTMISDMKCGRMDEAANIFDDIIAPETSVLEELQPAKTWAQWIQSWAMKAWNGEYTAAQSKIEDYQEDLDEYAGYPDYQKDLKAFNDIVDQITQLNSDVTSKSEGLIDEYADDVKELNELLSQLDEIVTQMQTNSGNNEAYNDYLNQSEMLSSAYQSVNDYAYQLAAWGYVNDEDQAVVRDQLLSIYRAILSLDAEVEANKNNSSFLAGVNAQVQERMSTIAATYTYVVKIEKEYLLENIFPQVQTAFNEAKYYVQYTNADNEDLQNQYPETYFQDVTTQMDAIVAAINAFEAPVINGTDLDNYAKWPEAAKPFVDAAQKQEQALGDLYSKLTSIVGGDAVGDVVTALNGRYDEVKDAYDSAIEALGTYDTSVQEIFNPIYKELLDALNNELTLWTKTSESETPGWVFTLEDNYLAALHIIENQIGVVAGNAADANQGIIDQGTIADLVAAYMAQYNDLVGRWNQVQAVIAGYGEGEFEDVDITAEVQFSINYTNNQMAGFDEWLDELGDDILNQSTQAQVTKKLKTIEGCIDRTESRGALAYDNFILEQAEGIRAEIAKILSNPGVNIIPDDKDDIFSENQQLTANLQGMNSEALGYDQYTSMELLNNLMENAQANYDAFVALLDKLNADTYILGDINGDPDGAIDIIDLQMLIQFVGQGLTFDQVAEEYGLRAAYAADVMGNNAIYNISDITKLQEMVLDYIANGSKSYIRSFGKKAVSAANVVDTQNSMSVALVKNENGVRTYALILNNPTQFIAGQIDLHTSGSARITEVYNAQRSQNHDVYVFENSNIDSRVIISSLQNDAFAGSTGAVIYFDVEGNGDVTLDNALFADGAFTAYELATATTTGVNTIIDNANGNGETYYDAAGRVYKRAQKGINIIRHNDGSVTKEIRK